MSTVRLLHAADLHLDSPFESLTEERAKERRAGQRKLLSRLARLSEDRGVQAILLSGDIFESDSVSPETERDFLRAFGALNIPVLVSPGNHDYYFPGCIWDRMELPENVHVFKNRELEAVRVPGLPMRFWGAGFKAAFSEPLLRHFAVPEKAEGLMDVMVIHGDLCSGSADYNAITAEELGHSGMDYVALGHIHKRSSIQKSGATAYAYPGCTEGRGYDETGECGAYIVTLSDGDVTAQFVPLGGVRYEIITVDVSVGDPASLVLVATEELSDKDFCRIILTGECESLPDTGALRRRFEGRFAELQIKDETVQKRDIWQLAGQDTLSGLFLSKLKCQMESAVTERERQVIELAAKCGLAAIENGGRK